MARRYTGSHKGGSKNKSKNNFNSRKGCNRNGFNDSSSRRDNGYYDDSGKSTNDWHWYAADPAILRDAASIPFSMSAGTGIDEMDPGFPKLTRLPGILTISLWPTVGNADNPNSPINVAATAAYSFVRHANSGHTNYDSPDLMLYIIAMSQVYSYINFLNRLYGSATLYSHRNRYLPRGIVESNNVDFDDLSSHLANFRYGVNVLVNKAASLAVPAEMTIFQRHAMLYQNIYIEGTSIKDQLYMYVPSGYLVYNETDGAGSLQPLVFDTSSVGIQGSRKFHVDDLLNYGNKLLDPILGSEDMNIMSGDILKAYGQNILKLTELPEQYPITPIFDIGVLEQMKNAVIMHTPSDISGYAVTQNVDLNCLVCKPYTSITSVFSGSNPPVTIPEELRTKLAQSMAGGKWLTTTTAEVSPELVIESSRLVVTVDDTQDMSNLDKLYVLCGTEIASRCTYWTFEETSPNNDIKLVNRSFTTFQPYNTAGSQQAEDLMIYLSKFDFHPLVAIYNGIVGTTNSLIKKGWYGDIDNFTILSTDVIRRLHEAAVMNELHVPSIAKI